MDTDQTVLIRLTAFAQSYLQKVVDKNNACGIVIALEKAGCAGYMYRVEPCATAPDDAVSQAVSATLTNHIPQESVPRLRGAQLDYACSALETKAVFDNPNVRMACGCGDSVGILS